MRSGDAGCIVSRPLTGAPGSRRARAPASAKKQPSRQRLGHRNRRVTEGSTAKSNLISEKGAIRACTVAHLFSRPWLYRESQVRVSPATRSAPPRSHGKHAVLFAEVAGGGGHDGALRENELFPADDGLPDIIFTDKVEGDRRSIGWGSRR